jgi:hypothetical protein
MNDPFASAPAEAQEVPVAAAEAPVSTPSRPAVATAAEGKITVTLKGGSGFDSPWIVIHAADAADALSQFDGPLAELMEKVQKAGTHFSGLKPASASGNAAPSRSAPQGATEAPAWAPPKPFDDFVYKTGVSAKNGKVWHAWMPPEKGDHRDPKFFYQN